MGATSAFLIDDAVGNGSGMIFDVNNNRDIIAYYVNGSEVFAIMSNGFIRTTSGWKYRQAGIGIGDIAVDNDDYTYPLLRCKHDITIVSAHIGLDEAHAADADNYQTFYLEQTGNSNDLGTLSTASTGFTAHVPREVSITTTNDQDHLAAGDTLTLRTVASGTPASTLTGCVVEICYTIDQPRATIGTVTDNVIRMINEAGTAAQLKQDFAHRPFLSIRESGNEKFHIDIDGKIHGAKMQGMKDYTPVDQYYYHVVNTRNLVTADSATKISPIFAPHCTVQIEHVYFGAATAETVASAANGWQIKITDATNILVDAYTHLYGAGTALTKGYLYDMGDVNREWGRLTSSDKLCAEYLETGTGPTVEGLTFVICYKKVV